MRTCFNIEIKPHGYYVLMARAINSQYDFKFLNILRKNKIPVLTGGNNLRGKYAKRKRGKKCV
jgi:hypothetical protein